MQKIDFFGGVHGNFLELVVNVAINQIEYNITKPQFTVSGACHLKNLDIDYHKMIVADHYSYFKIPFNVDDLVIRIVPTADDMLIGLTNCFLRAGDEKFDIDTLEQNTISKLSLFSKGANFANTIVAEHGTAVNYPRSVIRNYFYSMLSDNLLGLDMLTCHAPSTTQKHDFPFRAFFDLGNFYQELNKIAKFLGLNFYPSIALSKLHDEFLALNQGYHSEIKCKKVWQAILHNDSLDIKLNLLEEAWINHQAASCFRCYDLPLLIQDSYPSNTLEISNAIFKWKSQDYGCPTSTQDTN